MSEPSRRDQPWPRSARPVHPEPTARDEHGSRHVAILLACAAVLAAILTTRAAFMSNDASNNWQAALGNEVKRSALGLEAIRYLYTVEADLAYTVTIEQVRSEELRAAASSQPAAIGADLTAEADIYDGAVKVMQSASEVASDARYALPGGGYDVIRRLADTSIQDASTNAASGLHDPDVLMASGDTAADRATRMMATTIAVGLAFLFGAAAQAFGGRRRLFLGLGWAALLVAGLVALAVELLT